MPNAKVMSMKNMHIKLEVKGGPKTGKTKFMGTWPNLFAFVFDNGIKTLIGQDVNYQEFYDNDVTNPTAYVRALKVLREASRSAALNGKLIYDEEKDCFYIKKLEGEVKPPLKIIETVGVDCATPFLELCMNKVKKERGSAGQIPHEHDWFPQMTEFSTFMNECLALPCHVVMVTYEKIKEIKSRSGDITLGTRILPDLTGSLATKFEGKFDMIVRTAPETISGKTTYRLQTCFKGLYEAGHRFGDAFSDYIEPSYDGIMKAIDKYRERAAEVDKRLKDHEQGA